MKRFKTKQEFIRDYGKVKNWCGEMDFLFGMPQNCPEVGSWRIEDYHLTSLPHPYTGKSIVIKLENEDQSRVVQKKMFRMGVTWNTFEAEVKHTDATYLFLDWNPVREGHMLSFDNSIDETQYPILLSHKQFMNGDMPRSKVFGDVELNPQKVQKREIQYKIGDQVTFNIPGETITYKVSGHENKCFLSREGANYLIFTKLGIDKLKFIHKTLGRKSTGGQFPYCESLEELTKVIYALKEECIARCHADQMEFVVSSEPSWSIDTGKFESILFTPYSPSKQTENGRSIKVQRQAPAIRSGQSPKGSRVSGKASHASTRRGFIGYRAVSCRE